MGVVLKILQSVLNTTGGAALVGKVCHHFNRAITLSKFQIYKPMILLSGVGGGKIMPASWFGEGLPF